MPPILFGFNTVTRLRESSHLHGLHYLAGRRTPCTGIAALAVPAHARRARVPPPVHRPRNAGRRCRIRPDQRLHRIRRDGRFTARREPHPDHDAPAHAAGRSSSHRPDGRRHHQGRGPVRQGQEPAAALQRAHRRQHRGDPACLRALRGLRRRRGPDGRQFGLARFTRLHRVPARVRPAFLGQPDARFRIGEAAARPRAAALVPRVQLHGPAGVRLPGARAPLRVPPADGRLGPVGQHRVRGRTRATSLGPGACTA